MRLESGQRSRGADEWTCRWSDEEWRGLQFHTLWWCKNGVHSSYFFFWGGGGGGGGLCKSPNLILEWWRWRYGFARHKRLLEGIWLVFVATKGVHYFLKYLLGCWLSKGRLSLLKTLSSSKLVLLTAALKHHGIWEEKYLSFLNALNPNYRVYLANH